MFDFLNDNILFQFGGRVLKQTIGMQMGTNCPVLADLFLHSFMADCLQELSQKKGRKLVQTFNSSFRYTDDVLFTEQYTIR